MVKGEYNFRVVHIWRMVEWFGDLDHVGLYGCCSLVVVEEGEIDFGSFLVGFVVGHYLIDFDCFLLNLVGYYLGLSYFYLFLTNFVD